MGYVSFVFFGLFVGSNMDDGCGKMTNNNDVYICCKVDFSVRYKLVLS